ncbi:MAG: redoxin domain-containing protein [Bacteroidetes bacterium]|nr:redoxin domain-containing protein [Bacteroidota bacterium]
MKWLCTLILFAAMQVVTAQRVEYKTFAEVDSFFETSNDTLYVINFWATWCKPCIEELPSFEKLMPNIKIKK